MVLLVGRYELLLKVVVLLVGVMVRTVRLLMGVRGMMAHVRARGHHALGPVAPRTAGPHAAAVLHAPHRLLDFTPRADPGDAHRYEVGLAQIHQHVCGTTSE